MSQLENNEPVSAERMAATLAELHSVRFSEREWRWKAQDKIAECEALEADLSALREQLERERGHGVSGTLQRMEQATSEARIAENRALAQLPALREQLTGLVEALAPFWPDDYLLEAEDEGPTAFCLLLHGSLVERQAQADRLRELDALLHPKGSSE